VAQKDPFAVTYHDPFALSLSKGQSPQSMGFDKLSPNGSRKRIA
jgi:hypothetical protein